MSTYNAAQVFGGGQAFSITLSDGSIYSFTLAGTTPNADSLVAIGAPAWTGAAVGNTAFLGIPNKPILYTTAGGTVNLTFTNIKVTPPNGVISTGQFKFVVADAESTNTNESLTYTTNGGNWVVVDQVPPISGAIYPTSTGAGTNTYTNTGVGGTVGAFIVGSLSPTTATVQLVAGGLQGVMMAVQYATISTNKQIAGPRANAADQFNYGVKATSNGANIANTSSTGAGAGPFASAVATLSSGVPTTVYEQMAPGSISNINQYTSNLNCVNGAAGSPTVVPTNQPVTTYNLGTAAYGDAIACIFTNTAKPATVAIQKITTGAVGGAFTFSATNLASTPPAITTTATGTATPAAPTPINASAFNTAVTVTETPATNFAAATATCTDANSAITGNSGTFGTLSGNVLTIPAANILAAAQINCIFTNAVNGPTVALQKVTLGAAGGPFTFAATNLASTPAAITTASTGTAYPATVAPVPVTTVGNAVTITETPATNFTVNTASCTDTNAVVSGNPASFGTLVGNVLTIPATNVRTKAQIVCTFNNIANPAIPTVAIQKITTGAAGGPFTFTATNLTGTMNGITTVTAGTPAPTTPAPVTVTTTANPVTLTEAANSNFNITSATCTDTNSGTTGNPASFGSLAGSVVTIPAVNLKPFAKIICTFTNAAKTPTVAIQKITTGSFGGPFNFSATNLSAVPAAISTSAASTATPAAPIAIPVSATNTQVQITEAANGEFTLSSATCSDANASITGNPASFGTLSAGVLTIAAVNIVPAAQITCTFSNAAKPATVAVQKLTTGGAGGPFNFAVYNLAAAPAAISTAAANSAAPATPVANNVTTLNSVVQISETPSSTFTFSTASCTDANSAVTGNPASFGTLSGQLITIPAANVLPAAQITCTFTNAGNAPTISFQKALAASGRIAASDQFALSGTGTGAPAAVNTTGTAAAITSAPYSFTATANAAYSLNEAMAAGSTSLITAYAKTVACSNTNPVGTNVSPITTVPITFTAHGGDAISCTVTNNGVATPLLTITKTYAAAPSPVTVGQIVTYTYVISNTGNVPIQNVQVKDLHGSPPVQVPLAGTGIKGETLTTPGPLGAGASPDGASNDGVWQTLAPGASVTFTWAHTVTQSEIDHG